MAHPQRGASWRRRRHHGITFSNTFSTIDDFYVDPPTQPVPDLSLRADSRVNDACFVAGRARLVVQTRRSSDFLLVELVLLFAIRDSPLLNVLMLIYPLDAVKAWQSAM